ncbi:hydantoinase/oxoprolinase family protein [Rhodococcus sp. MEB041]|uniref:hydantoinase/oxoprolinase family protein n=1 Tax=Rhodococcus sp. MEB041 TaxID=3040323 RepID=UPI00254B4920|nr:hydantoinase/oxoprolinase family protein [Rhodococcus sp. MEB041]
MGFTIGVDVGGTFTDIVLSDGERTWRDKAPTDPQEFGRGVLQACDNVAARAGTTSADLMPKVERFGLGTTAVTNVLTVRKGMRVGLLTTAGFEDVISSARSRRVSVDGWLEVPWQPVERSCVRGVPERIGRGGVVVDELDEAAAIAALDELVRDQGVESIAVSLLWSFANSVHEDRVTAIARERYPEIPVFSGAELHPSIREYERTMVAVLNAFSGNALDGIDDLAKTLVDMGLRSPMLLLQANGGTTTLDEARRSPFSLNSSGPSAGVVAAAEFAAAAGFSNALCGDAGGTSFDVALVREGLPQRTQRGTLHGVITAQSTVDVESIGAAGGSIAWVDDRGLLRVGPESARAMPGPACYGRGGTQPTLTDAMVVLGYIDPASFLRGTMPLDAAAALEACATVGAELGLSGEEVALGIHAIAVEQMGKAARLLATSSGLEPRSLAFLGYGGSGPLFSGDLARIAGVPTVLVPLPASVLSAFGAACAEVRRERLTSVDQLIDSVDTESLSAKMKSLGQDVYDDVERNGVPESGRRVEFEADIRFHQQSFELTIPLGDGAFDAAQIKEHFLAQYSQRYGTSAITLGTPVEVAAVRAIGIGKLPRAAIQIDPDGVDTTAKPDGTRQILLDENGRRSVDVYVAANLRPGHTFTGPAIVDQGDTTIVVPDGYRATRDSRHTLKMEAI